MVAQTVGFILLVAIVLFGAAGRIHIPLFWAYLGVLAGVSVAGLFLTDEDLARERTRPGGHLPGLRLYFIFLLCVAHWTIAGLDRRFHWSDTIPAIVASGMALCSWLAAALGALGVPLLIWRTIIEDRTLRAELPGYAEYAQQVRWRLLPGMW